MGKPAAAVAGYAASLDPDHRQLLERIHALIVATIPDATVTISYQIPIYRVGRLHVRLNARRTQLWAGDYEVLRRNRYLQYLAPRGLGHVEAALSGAEADYAVTATRGANSYTLVAPVRSLLVYTPDPRRLASDLELIAAPEGGGNVLLLEPYDPVVREEATAREGLRVAPAPQIVADLRTGPGRGEAEAVPLLAWMRATPQGWRGG